MLDENNKTNVFDSALDGQRASTHPDAPFAPLHSEPAFASIAVVAPQAEPDAGAEPVSAFAQGLPDWDLLPPLSPLIRRR